MPRPARKESNAAYCTINIYTVATSFYVAPLGIKTVETYLCWKSAKKTDCNFLCFTVVSLTIKGRKIQLSRCHFGVVFDTSKPILKFCHRITWFFLLKRELNLEGYFQFGPTLKKCAKSVLLSFSSKSDFTDLFEDFQYLSKLSNLYICTADLVTNY